jgi:hypothetical protein
MFYLQQSLISIFISKINKKTFEDTKNLTERELCFDSIGLLLLGRTAHGDRILT